MKLSPNVQTLTPPHVLLATAIAAIWGTNFVIIKIGLNGFPPLWFAFLRFVLVFLPAALFIRRPAVPWLQLATYGLLVGGGQFGLLYIAMNGHISPGLASVVVQSQVFFTIAIAVVKNGERLSPNRWFTLSASCAGFITIAICGTGDITPFGLVLVLLAGLSWGIANLIIKGAPARDMLGYVVWASLFAVPTLLGFSLALEGFGALLYAISTATPGAWASLIWQSTANTIFGFAAWGWLLSRNSATSVAPFALLVPVFGMVTSIVILNEKLQLWKIAGAGLIMLALCGPYLWTQICWIGQRFRHSDNK